MTPDSDVLIVEGVGGLMVPLDPKHTVRDLAQWLKLPGGRRRPAEPGDDQPHAADGGCVAGGWRDGCGASWSTGTRRRGRAPPRRPTRGRSSKWGRMPVLTIVPDEPVAPGRLPPGIVAAADTVDWQMLAERDEFRPAWLPSNSPDAIKIDAQLIRGDFAFDKCGTTRVNCGHD